MVPLRRQLQRARVKADVVVVVVVAVVAVIVVVAAAAAAVVEASEAGLSCAEVADSS